METKKNSHWRKVMGTTYLNGDEIAETGQVVTILDYKEEKIYSQKSKEKENHVLLTFKELDKPMILTNRKAKQISNVVNTPLMDEWKGKTITIFPVNEKHFGEYFKVINVKPGEIVKTPLNSKHPKWENACAAIKEGKSTIEAIEKHYSITQAVRTQLEKLMPQEEEPDPAE